MTTDRELMQQALDALEVEHSAIYGTSQTAKAIKALRARLAQPEPEPVAWKRPVYMVEDGWDEFGFTDSSGDDVPLYTTPPQREFIGLTDEEIREFEIWLDNDEEEHGWNPPENIVKYIEQALKEKNT